MLDMATREILDLSAGGTVSQLVPSLPGEVVREAAWAARCAGHIDAVLGAELDLDDWDLYGRRRDLAWGEPLFSEGRPAKGVWIVRDGEVELFVGSGRARQVVEVLGPGGIDGDIQSLLGLRLAYSARAATDLSAWFLAIQSFRQLLSDRPVLAGRWLTSVASRIANSHRRIVALLGQSLTVQVARLLRDEAIDREVHLPQRTLAAMLCVQRPSLTKVLKELEKRGLVDIGYGRITITDPAGLTQLAD